MQAEAHCGVSTRLTAGRLEGMSVPDLYWALSTARATGVLHLNAGVVAKRVFFSAGRITFAASNDPNDRLGELLLRHGTIRLEHFERAVARLTDGRRLGTILVESGQLSPENLIAAVRDQVRHIVCSLIPWEDGEYRFDEGPLPIDEIVTLDIDTASILLHGMRTIRPFQRIRRSVGPPNTRYQAVEGWRAAVANLDLSDGERELLERVDGTGETVENLCREVFLSNFEIHQALWAFKVLGWARECGRAIVALAEESTAGGCLDNDGIGKLLIRLSRAGDTGVLQVVRGVAERTFHLREGHLVFATSNNVDDGLVAYLLRRGMISLRDREETVRRQLSNKRVGQILLEMNVIEEAELAKLIREHQTEIVLDTFRWTDGAWMWLSGELPTFENIVLDRSVDDIVLAGIRRVAAWSRVREGCAGFSTRLELTANYLGILDRMNISAEDWEMIAILRTPTTPLEVCRALNLGDFRVCQNLWALRLLGVVDEAPLEDALDAALGNMGANAVANDASQPAPPEPQPPPVPIAPASVDGEAAFEVTTVHQMTPDAPADDRAVPASTWIEPTGDAPAPWTWRTSDDRPTPVAVSEAVEGAEMINEAWRLVGDDVRPVEPAPTADSDAVVTDSPVEERAFALVPESASVEAHDQEPFEHAPLDAAPLDAVPLDAAPLDAAPLDAAPLDAAPLDAAPLDAAPLDAAPDHSPADDGPEPLQEDDASARFQTDARPDSVVEPFEADEQPELSRADEAPDQFQADMAKAILDDRGSDVPDLPARPWMVEEPEDTVHEAAETAPQLAVASPEPAIEIDAAPAWVGPADLDLDLAQFVERHKVVFRVIRSEVGAGAVNFVRSCRSALDSDAGEILSAAEMLVDGGWSVDELGALVRERRLAGAPVMFRRLIDFEVATLRAQIGERRTRALLEQIESIAGGATSPR